jgi:hypothetical protein
MFGFLKSLVSSKDKRKDEGREEVVALISAHEKSDPRFADELKSMLCRYDDEKEHKA